MAHVNKMKLRKQKSKNDLKTIATYKIAVKEIRTLLKLHYEKRLKHWHLFELYAFYFEKKWTCYYPITIQKSSDENIYIGILEEIIAECNIQLFFNSIAEQFFTQSDVHSDNDKYADFLSYPLWNFPVFDTMQSKHYEYTFNDINPLIKPFHDQFAQLKDKLFKTYYTPENLVAIKQMCRENLQPHIATIQQAIDDSLYISQLRNQTKGDTGLQFCLGITSAENLVNYYEKAEIIQPYVAAETKDRLSRHIDLKAGSVFCYVKFR